MAGFIRVHNKVVNLEQISYVEFLDSGRAMIFMNGLTPEKQNIPVEPDETRKLKAVMDRMVDAVLSPNTVQLMDSIPTLVR
jgi:hypothetical protein